MNRENASFTFLHRVEEIELNIRDVGNQYIRWFDEFAAALSLSNSP